MDAVLKSLHKQGKKGKLVTDASIKCKHTPVFEHGMILSLKMLWWVGVVVLIS